MGFVFIPILPEMLDALYAAKGITEGENERTDMIIADKAAGLYGAFYSVGMILSPIIGGLAYEFFEGYHDKRAFNKTCDVWAVGSLAFTVLYLCWNVLPDIKNLDSKQEEQLRALSHFEGKSLHSHNDLSRAGSVNKDFDNGI